MISPLRRKSLLLLKFLLGFVLLCGGFAVAAWSYLTPRCEVRPGIVYGQRNGHDLVMDIARPEKPNGAAIVLMLSGDWVSPKNPFQPALAAPLLRHGYTVFAIHHLSQPDATVMEIVADVNRALRFIRLHAAENGIDPTRIGVTGASSGGHLAMMLATCGTSGDPQANDPIDRESSRVQAAAVFFPVTDLVDFGDSTQNLHDGGPPKNFVKAFGLADRNPTAWLPIARAMSPILHVDGSLPPILIHHGDKDSLIPFDRSERFQQAAAVAGRPITLVPKKGKGHGWLTMIVDLEEFARWFDQQLAPPPAAGKPAR